MDGMHLVASRVKSPVRSYDRPTLDAPPADKTIRTAELEKGMQQPMVTRQTAPSITLGNK